MSILRLPGLATGIDTNALIAQLMAIERRTLKMYEQRQSLWEERKQALSTLQTKLDSLRSTVKALSDARQLRAFTVASSNSDILTAEASYNAFEGNHTVVINQLANAERWVHTSGLRYTEDYVGAGTFIYSYNQKETTITTTATTTLEDLVGLINNDANNPGVTAGLLYYNGAYHLVLNGNEAGTDYRVSINASNTEVWKTTSAFTVRNDDATLSSKIIDLDQFSGTLAGNEKIIIGGQDHNGNAISGVLNITSGTRLTHLISQINDAFDGRATATLVHGEIRLTDNTCGTSQMKLTLTYDNAGSDSALAIPTISRSTQGGTIPANLAGFAAANFTRTQSAQDSKIRVDGFPSAAAVAEVQTLTPTTPPSNGTYTLTYDGQTTSAIQYNADTATIKAALEALLNVNTDDITVGGGANGLADGALTFTFRDTAGDVGLISIDPSGLNQPDPSNYSIVETTKGSDGWISRSSNTIDNIISGVTLYLHDTTDASGQDITLTRNIESVKEKLNSMVQTYNAAVVYIQEKTGYNDILKTAGVLMGDYVVSTIRSQIHTPLIAQTSGFIEDIDTFLMPGQIGLELDRDGVLSLDTNAFYEAITKDYMGVLAVIGADKTGSTNSNTIRFYGASSNFTRAGTYNFEVTISGGAITSAKIKLASEAAYRNATFSGNIVTGDSSFDENGNPLYPENGLQLTVDLSRSGTFTATVRVKQGFTGALEDALDGMLKVTTGSVKIDQKHVGQAIKELQRKIELEEDRLTQKEARLVQRFARLERTLALLQNQMSALGFGQT